PTNRCRRSWRLDREFAGAVAAAPTKMALRPSLRKAEDPSWLKLNGGYFSWVRSSIKLNSHIGCVHFTGLRAPRDSFVRQKLSDTRVAGRYSSLHLVR